MKRRKLILIAGASLVPTTGCIDRSVGTDTSETRIPTTENRQVTTTESRVESTASPTARPTEKETTEDDTAEATASPTAHPTETDATEQLLNRLEIHYVGEKDIKLKITLINLSSEEETYAEQYTLTESETVNLTEYIGDGIDYKILLEMNEDRIYNRKMYDYEYYVLSVHPNGEVKIKEHAMA